MNKPYLKSMDINGYRSYATPVHIDFSQKLNVIIGPHGTGKSNILDAIKWCLSDDGGDTWRGKDCNNQTLFTEVSLTFGTEDNANPEMVLKRRIEYNRDNDIIKTERFINGELIPEGLFSFRLHTEGFLTEDISLDRKCLWNLQDDKYSANPEFVMYRFLPTPLCLIDDSLSPSDEPLNKTFLQMVNALEETSQCIAVSYLKDMAMKADRIIGVTFESDSSKVYEIKKI